ncbi:hypothetical protein NGRRMQZB_74 [Escherichia phage Dru_SM1]
MTESFRFLVQIPQFFIKLIIVSSDSGISLCLSTTTIILSLKGVFIRNAKPKNLYFIQNSSDSRLCSYSGRTLKASNGALYAVMPL